MRRYRLLLPQREHPGRGLQAAASAPGRQLAAVVTFVEDKRVEVMSDGGLGLGQGVIRGGALKIGRCQAADGLAPSGSRSSQALDQGCG